MARASTQDMRPPVSWRHRARRYANCRPYDGYLGHRNGLFAWQLTTVRNAAMVVPTQRGRPEKIRESDTETLA